MSIAIIAIGIPASGKTTLLRPFAERHGLVVISRDEIRKELFGDPLARNDQMRVWTEADKRAQDTLSAGRSVILDSTFAERAKRASVIASARAAGAQRVIGIIFSISPEVAKERNRLRDVQVREDVIDHVHEKLLNEPPILDEGFDALYAHDELDTLEKEFGGNA